MIAHGLRTRTVILFNSPSPGSVRAGVNSWPCRVIFFPVGTLIGSKWLRLPPWSSTPLLIVLSPVLNMSLCQIPVVKWGFKIADGAPSLCCTGCRHVCPKMAPAWSASSPDTHGQQTFSLVCQYHSPVCAQFCISNMICSPPPTLSQHYRCP